MKVKLFLMGGLGNNLFQIAAGEELKNSGIKVEYNFALMNENIFTKFIGFTIHDSKIQRKILENQPISEKFELLDLFAISIIFLKKKFFRYNIQSFDFHKIFNLFNIKSYLVGYWQDGPHLNDKNFNILKKKLLASLCITKEDVESYKDLYGSKTIIHFRGGDFNKCARVNDKYYIKAIKKLKPSKLFILTIDKDAAIEIFGKDAEYISSGKIELDIMILMSCKKLISSNSTFCYWCALLGDSDEIVLPKKLFSDRGFFLPLTKKSNTII